MFGSPVSLSDWPSLPEGCCAGSSCFVVEEWSIMLLEIPIYAIIEPKDIATVVAMHIERYPQTLL